MGAKRHAMHGRDHVAGGADPIPGLAAAANMWPNTVDLLRYDSSFVLDESANWTPTVDLTYRGGWYLGETADGAYFIKYARLGPKGSVWAVQGSAELGPDCGKVKISMQVIPETPDGVVGVYDLDGLNMISGSYDNGIYGSARTFYTIKNTGAYPSDLYNAVQNKNSGALLFSEAFRIMGDDGAPITANGTLSTMDNSIYHMDGGSGIWAIKVETSGKNSSSSGYKVRLTSLSVTRHTSDQFDAN